MAAPFSASDAGDVSPDAAQADVVFLGEQHDNPGHHAVQASWVHALKPSAIVFEMLTPEQAGQVTAENRQNEEMLESALGWNASGWPDFKMYFPIFQAAPDAAVVGAGVPRARVRDLMAEDLATVAGPEFVARFGLDQPLPTAQQAAREELQRVAHCDALPETLLPRMVSVQRLRDAALSQAALDAFDRHGAPVVVITGNGHAREDWGAPYLLRATAPDLVVFSLGQGEDGMVPDGGFGAVVQGAGVDRGDPCAAFSK